MTGIPLTARCIGGPLDRKFYTTRPGHTRFEVQITPPMTHMRFTADIADKPFKPKIARYDYCSDAGAFLYVDPNPKKEGK